MLVEAQSKGGDDETQAPDSVLDTRWKSGACDRARHRAAVHPAHHELVAPGAQVEAVFTQARERDERKGQMGGVR